MLRLRKFMFDEVYLGQAALGEHEKAHRTLRGLFDHYMEHPDEIPRAEPGAGECQRVADYIAGMTDRYAHRPLDRADDPRGGEVLVALISPDSLERVKQAADIVEVVSAHTDLKRQGARMVGLCPFHEERTPSFSVDPQEKLYHCFGCGVGGDTIKFVEEKEGLGFAEAVELLADRYGVELEREREDPQAEARRQQRRKLGELLDRTASFYASYLWDSEEAGKARAYLAERGLEEETLRRFGVGYAPSAWDTVLIRGQRAGFDVAAAARGRPRPEGAGRRRVRPLPGPDHVPDPRPPRAHLRLRRAGDALRPGRQVRQHGRDRVLPQERDALRDRPRQGGDRQGRARGRGRGLHRRPRPPSGRGSRRRSA